MINNELAQQIQEFYYKKGNLYKDGYKFARAFKEQNPNFSHGLEAIAKYYRRLKDGEDLVNNETKYNTNIEEDKTTKVLERKVEKQITSLQEAIDFFEVDTNIWEVVSWRCKSWGTSMKLEEITEKGKKITIPTTRTNYLVSVNLKKKEIEVDCEEIKKIIDSWQIKPVKLQKGKGKEIGVLTVADIHLGLKTSKFNGIVSTPEYNLEVAINYLKAIADKVNSLGYEEVHLILLGDIVESVTGYNHLETIKEMEYGITGGNIIILGYEVVLKFIQSIVNLKKVYIISGNHDRLSATKNMDLDGGAAQLIAYMLNKHIETIWHPMILNVIIDNISYILTHGHLNINKQDIGKIILQYGKQDLYNVFLEAHLHHRRTKKVIHNENLMLVDTTKYRAITVPSVVTGSRWSESMGFGSTPGFLVTQANSRKDNINQLDYSL